MRIGSRALVGSAVLRLRCGLPGLGFDAFAVVSIWMVVEKQSRS
jgi:hypothetical protein